MSVESSLNTALRQFEIAEANFNKAKEVLQEIISAIPNGISFTNDLEYENNCRVFNDIWKSLPKIDGWKPEIILMELNEIAQNRMDAMEIDEIEMKISIEQRIIEPLSQINEYHYRFNQKRKELIRDAISELVKIIDTQLIELTGSINESEYQRPVTDPLFSDFKNNVKQIDFLLGSSVPRPANWNDLQRHLHFGLYIDLHDIITNDWPNIKNKLQYSLYTEKEPIPLDVEDLGDLIKKHPKGKITTKLMWEKLSEDDFERLIFTLISSEKDYENPEWLMKTNAPDHGRDISAYRVHADSLGGIIRERIIIQCKHWLLKSISPADISILKEQIKLWEPPRIDTCIIATSGRFTADAVSLIEKNNQSDTSLKIEMWPESHLERLLASRPAIIAEFTLR